MSNEDKLKGYSGPIKKKLEQLNIKDANVSKPSGSTLTDREFFNIKISDFIKGEISDTDNILFEPSWKKYFIFN